MQMLYTGMYCIHMHIHVHEPCVQQSRPGGVAIYNVYVGIQCKLRYVALVRNYTTIILMKNQCVIVHTRTCTCHNVNEATHEQCT